MHELSVAQGVVDEILGKLGDVPVTKVRLAIGRRSGVFVDSIRFCFDLVVEDTSLAGAELVVDEPPGNDLRIVSVEVVRTCAAPAAAATTPG
ncbi:hydrogenase maturation nickel metallochaperone HypA [Actinophytocola sp.]|jgi:hydrogenase nickel incorporation protein HypA/HybF|uniref:hydrogenase maturation nickel metallochaperone HypA/HybF n=1 Tax=Actinophytocola sp. TaxID=1872138 RepID=UPI002D451598|nr:hydrogenase maturation nickel metallochaperone HypA [Actinophytocola sp.]HYQ66620.1 hydrogenase maturation nickel metallochaperone HypA [Actinophytocola sp.]